MLGDKDDKDLIFISFSRGLTRKVSEVLYKVTRHLYRSKEGVEIFQSSMNLGGGRFEAQIQDKLQKAKVGVSLLSRENIHKAPWLMYEAGALALSTEINNGVFLPYLFCRHIDDIESPIKGFQSFQYQRDSEHNLDQLIRLFEEINKGLSPSNQIDVMDIRLEITDYWKKTIGETLKTTASTMHDAPSAYQRTLDNVANKIIDIEQMETIYQNNAFPINDFHAATPDDLDKQFERILQDYIPEEWKKERNNQEEEYRSTRVIINDTRISTFVVFTDGENILLFDRKADPKNTNVINDRYDVFGSVQFENRTIRNKITSKAFLSAPIKRIAPIFGGAFESNRKKEGDGLETAVMFGIVVYLEKEALLSAKQESRDTLVIYPITAAQRLPANQLTSKADLGIKHLAQQRTT